MVRKGPRELIASVIIDTRNMIERMRAIWKWSPREIVAGSACRAELYSTKERGASMSAEVAADESLDADSSSVRAERCKTDLMTVNTLERPRKLIAAVSMPK